jgi:hypothetical protein
MDNERDNITCAQCGQLIVDESPTGDPEKRKPCPNCGSLARAFSVHLRATIALSASIAQAEVITYPQTLLSTARSLVDGGQFSIAIIVAHMACEIATERTISEAFTQKGIEYLQDPVYKLLNGFNLNNDQVRSLYNVLTGDQIQGRPFWDKFKESAARRNRIIRNSLTVGKLEAEESINVAHTMISYLKKIICHLIFLSPTCSLQDRSKDNNDLCGKRKIFCTQYR